MDIHYKPQGTCSTEIHFQLKDGALHNVHFENGCQGNLKAISVLVEGMNAEEAVKKLGGIRCGRRRTSCADQLARAIEEGIH